MMGYRIVALTLCSVFLVACGGGSNSSPNHNTTPAPSGGGTTVNTQPQFTQNICNRTSQNADLCDMSFTSLAPPQADGASANPGDSSTMDCDYAASGTNGETTEIQFTVFLPPYAVGDKFPLVLHSHGWGGSRARNTTNVDDRGNNTFEGIAQRLGDIRDAGYIVISFDQRGWGTSKNDGNSNTTALARVIDPCYETVDAMALVDWAVDNLGDIIADDPDGISGDIALGSVGGSYGGAYQMMLAAMDDRIDSIMPVATWHSLADSENKLLGATTVDGETDNFYSSLVNHEVLKNGYVTGLCALVQTAQAQVDPIVQTACSNVLAGASSGDDLDNGFVSTGGVDIEDNGALSLVAAAGSPTGDPAMRALFAANGMGRANLRGNRSPMDVDVFLVQGNRDMVFDGTAAYGNYEYFTDANNNSGIVKFMTTDGGHMLTTFEQVMSGYNAALEYQKQGKNNCGATNMFDAMLTWLDGTLKPGDPSHALTSIPDICIAFDSDNGVNTLTSIPKGNTTGTYSFGDASNSIIVNTTTIGAAEESMPVIAGSPRQFVSLATMSTNGFIAGIPMLKTLKVEADTTTTNDDDVTAFLAIGIKRPDGNGGFELIEVNEQITPIRRAHNAASAAIDYTNLRMPLVGYQLLAGDEVGLLLYRRHGQFQRVPGTTTEYNLNAYQIHGTIQIPIFDNSNTAIAP